MNRLLTSCTLSLLMWAGAARAAQDGPVQAPTKAQTLDQLQGWDLPTPAAVAFSGEVPIKDAGGSTIKARVGDDAIYYVHPMAGQRIFKVGDAWGIDTKFDDGAMGRYTYKVVKNGDGLGLASHTAQVGAFLGKPFALLDEDSNGRFNDSGADVLVYDKKLAVKLGEKFDVDGKSYKAAATASGKSVTFETYVAFDGGTASGDGGPDDTLALWNQIRASLKVPPVQRDPKLEAWAVKHMEYMNAVGGLTHPEDKNHPKFTAEGHKSGMGSCLAQGRPNARESLLGLLDSFFHRIPLIRPELEFTTVSYDPNGRFGVFDWQNGTPRKSPQWPGPLCYPPDGASNVRPGWNGREGPSPIPVAPPPGGVGETITLTFPPNMRGAKDAKIEVLENGKDAVDGWTSDPEHPASAMFKDNMNTICFIAKTVMKEQASYTVRVTATVGGKPFAHQWSFKTGNADFGFGPPRPRR